MGNVGSIKNMLKHVGHSAVISADPDVIKGASKLIVAGVGAFDSGVKNFQALLPLVNEMVLEKRVPILGICLGMQLFSKSSEEGSLPGFGWINARTVRFKFGDTEPVPRVPHMGWNAISVRKPSSRLLANMSKEARFYFVHSYHYCDAEPSSILTTTHYGIEFVSGIEQGNVYGVQFHPEKSHTFGMKLLANFAELT